MTAWSADLVQPQRQFDTKPLVLPAGSARADRLVFPGQYRRPDFEFTTTRGIYWIEIVGLLPGERGAVLAPLPVRHIMFDVPHEPVDHIDWRTPALVARQRAVACLKVGARGADRPGADDRRFVVVLIIDLGPITV